MLIKLTGGKVYDPTHQVDGKVMDIYIRDGKAAIEFRSYYGGKTVIKAVSSGLQTDSLAIETKGSPRMHV